MIEIAINNGQTVLDVDESRLHDAVQRILVEAGIRRGEVSIAVIDDTLMQTLNATHLNHDYPTDVLSFVHEFDGDTLDGEIIVSADTAIREAETYAWPAGDELLLYVIHGALHLVGHDDHNDEDLAAMRAAEARQLGHFGLTPRYAEGEVGRTSKSAQAVPDDASRTDLEVRSTSPFIRTEAP